MDGQLPWGASGVLGVLKGTGWSGGLEDESWEPGRSEGCRRVQTLGPQ